MELMDFIFVKVKFLCQDVDCFLKTIDLALKGRGVNGRLSLQSCRILSVDYANVGVDGVATHRHFFILF